MKRCTKCGQFLGKPQELNEGLYWRPRVKGMPVEEMTDEDFLWYHEKCYYETQML